MKFAEREYQTLRKDAMYVREVMKIYRVFAFISFVSHITPNSNHMFSHIFQTTGVILPDLN